MTSEKMKKTTLTRPAKPLKKKAVKTSGKTAVKKPVSMEKKSARKEKNPEVHIK